MDDLACRLGEGACGNPQLCSVTAPRCPGLGQTLCLPNPGGKPRLGCKQKQNPRQGRLW